MSWWWFVVVLLCCYLMLMCDSSADAGVLASTFVDLPTMTQAWLNRCRHCREINKLRTT